MTFDALCPHCKRRFRTSKPPRPATPFQARVLGFIEQFISKHRFAPTFDEIGDALGLSKITAREHVLNMQNRGILTVQPRIARSIRIIPSSNRRPSHEL